MTSSIGRPPSDPAIRLAPDPALAGLVERYRADGYVVVEGLFRRDDIDAARDILDGLFRRYQELPAGSGYNLAESDGDGTTSGVPAIRDVLRLHPELRGLGGLANVVRVAEHLHGPGAEPLWDAAIYKPPRDPSETPWHQDVAIYSMRRMRRPRWIAYAWVALEDLDADMGGIRFIPGSHAGPVLPHRWAGGGMATVDPVDPSRSVAPRLRAGDATIHHVATLHGSGPNGSDAWRKGWVLGIGRPLAPRWLRGLRHRCRSVTGF